MWQKRIATLIVLSVCLLTGGVWFVAHEHGPIVINAASAAETDEGILAALQEGCANAVSAVRSGSGQATVYFWSKGADGRILETEAKDDLKFRGDRFLLRENVKYLRSDLPVPPKDHPLPPPLTMRTSASSYDLEEVTILDQFDSLAPQARICDPTRGRGKNAITLYKTHVAIVGHGVAYLVPPPGVLPSFIGLASVKVAGRETINGDECIMVDVVTTMHLPNPGEGTITQTARSWVNPQKGYTIVKVQVWLEGSVYSAKTLVTEINTTVRQYETGVWGPEKATYQQYDLRGEITQKLVTTYDLAFKLNVPISDGDLTLTLPSGTRVHNELIDSEYTVP